jgi:hypothetical protein
MVGWITLGFNPFLLSKIIPASFVCGVIIGCFFQGGRDFLILC